MSGSSVEDMLRPWIKRKEGRSMSPEPVSSAALATIILDGLDNISDGRISAAAQTASKESDFPDEKYGSVEILTTLAPDLLDEILQYATSLQKASSADLCSILEDLSDGGITGQARDQIARAGQSFAVIRCGESGILPAAVDMAFRFEATPEQQEKIEEYLDEGEGLVSRFMDLLMEPVEVLVRSAIESVDIFE